MQRIETILHPTDFSDHSVRAFRIAESLARRNGCCLVLVHVTQMVSSIAYRGVIGGRIVGRPFERLWRQLEDLAPSDPRIKVERRLEVGDPASEIVRVAQVTRCSLITMGTHGRTGLSRLLMGSVAERVLRSAPCPVLTVKTSLAEYAMTDIKTILHPTDFSPPSEYAFRLACSLAHDYSARVLVVHVAPPPPPTFVGYHATGVSSQQADEHYLESLRSSVRHLKSPDPNVHIEERIAEGDVTADILRIADESKADLIVMGTHGRTGLNRLLLGSVAEQVLRRASCPVLTAKLPSPDTGAEEHERTEMAHW